MIIWIRGKEFEMKEKLVKICEQIDKYNNFKTKL